MKKTINISLVITVIVPVVLLFWPFVTWNDAMSLIFRVVPALAGQVLLYRIGKWYIIKALPAVLTGVFAAWGTYLYCTSSHWNTATLGDLIADYASPFICCTVALIVCTLTTKKK